MPHKKIYRKRAKLTILVNKEERDALNQYARDRGTAVNPLIRKMILDLIEAA